MRCGDFAAAWAISDEVLRWGGGGRARQAPLHEQVVWDGSPLHGRRVLIRCHHGLGDTLQFIRYAPRALTVAAEVTVLAQPALLPLLRTMPGIGRLLPLGDGMAGEVPYDVDVEVMELPHVFRTAVSTIPAEIPYLHVPAAQVAPGEREQQLHVGLVWSAGGWGEGRSMSFAACAPLFAVDGVTIHILQRGPALADCPPELGVHSGSDDILEAARRMRALDLVLTVDSMPAHLAGALGVPVWTMLPEPADWRWMHTRDDCPWYPTMRLFRQERRGEWQPVIARVCAELRALVGRRRAAGEWAA